MISYFKLDFLDSDYAHETDSGLVGKVSLTSSDRPAVSAVQAHMSREI